LVHCQVHWMKTSNKFAFHWIGCGIWEQISFSAFLKNSYCTLACNATNDETMNIGAKRLIETSQDIDF
jgi:hypothetical protein